MTAGMTYCALAALTLLDRVPALDDTPGLIRWLTTRQTPFQKKHEMDEDDLELLAIKGTPDAREEAEKVELCTDGRPRWGGFNGRCNKLADTCYSFWVGASLDVGPRTPSPLTPPPSPVLTRGVM